MRAFADRHFSGEDHYTREADQRGRPRSLGAPRATRSGTRSSRRRASRTPRGPSSTYAISRDGRGQPRKRPMPRRRGAWASRGSRSWPAISCRRSRTPTWPSTTGNASSDSAPDPASHLAQMLSQPMRLEILLDLLSTSQFLADALVAGARLSWTTSASRAPCGCAGPIATSHSSSPRSRALVGGSGNGWTRSGPIDARRS